MKKRKYLLLVIAAICLIFQVSCSGKETLQKAGEWTSILHLLGTIGIVAAIILYLFKDKVRDFLRGKNFMKFLLAGVSLYLLCEGEIFAQTLDFQPAVDTFCDILLIFSNITAGACGFYGLTRVAWLLVNEERSSGTALVMSIIGFVVATIAVGLLR